MDAVVVEDEALYCLLESIDVDEWDDEDAIRAMCEFQYSYIFSVYTFEVLSYCDGRCFIFAVKGTVAGVEFSGVWEDVAEEFVDEGDEE